MEKHIITIEHKSSSKKKNAGSKARYILSFEGFSPDEDFILNLLTAKERRWIWSSEEVTPDAFSSYVGSMKEVKDGVFDVTIVTPYTD